MWKGQDNCYHDIQKTRGGGVSQLSNEVMPFQPKTGEMAKILRIFQG